MLSPVEQIKQKINILDLVSSYIKVERSGSSFKARCPFHKEKTASFFVSPARNGYYCFGCNRGGDIFTFVEDIEGVDFKGALKILADRAGVNIEKNFKEGYGEQALMFRALSDAAEFFSANLAQNPSALEYLKKRGITDETIKKFSLGYARDNFTDLCNFLKKKG